MEVVIQLHHSLSKWNSIEVQIIYHEYWIDLYDEPDSYCMDSGLNWNQSELH